MQGNTRMNIFEWLNYKAAHPTPTYKELREREVKALEELVKNELAKSRVVHVD